MTLRITNSLLDPRRLQPQTHVSMMVTCWEWYLPWNNKSIAGPRSTHVNVDLQVENTQQHRPCIEKHMSSI